MIKIKAKVTTKGKGVSTRVGSLLTGSVELGVLGEAAAKIHPSAGIPVGAVAAAHELGLVPGAPRRAWLSGWVDANQAMMRRDAMAAALRVLTGKSTETQTLHALGQKWADALRANILSGGVSPSLAPRTVKDKRSRIPLLETGLLAASIGYDIRKDPISAAVDIGKGLGMRAASAALDAAARGFGRLVGKRR